MRTIVVDKIASITQACGLGHEVRIATENLPSEEGVIVVVEVLTSKSNYNTLELTSGRMAKVNKGDIVVGALGHRKALFGYSGHVPPTLAAGDIINMLNIGGVLGVCDSANPQHGKPFECRVLGVVLTFPYLGERIGVPARAGFRKLDFDAPLDAQGVPVVALAGTDLANALPDVMTVLAATTGEAEATNLWRELLAVRGASGLGGHRSEAHAQCEPPRSPRAIFGQGDAGQ